MKSDGYQYGIFDWNGPNYHTAVYSMQGTGTRFILKFFKHHGNPIWHRHVTRPIAEPEERVIVPVRNPIDCLRTWKRNRYNFTDEEFIAKWGEYILKTANKDAFYFPLDIAENRRVLLLTHAIQFIGVEPKKDFIRQYAKDWAPVGAGDGSDVELEQSTIDALDFAVAWYRHYTEHYGPHLQATKLGDRP